MDVRWVSRLCLAAAGAAALGGCSTGYIYATYSTPVAPILVTVGCHTTYEVYENLKTRTMMVRSNVAADVAAVVCRDDPGVGPRPRRAVEIHLQKTNRPACSIGPERRLSPIHWEFPYSCPA